MSKFSGTWISLPIDKKILKPFLKAKNAMKKSEIKKFSSSVYDDYRVKFLVSNDYKKIKWSDSFSQIEGEDGFGDMKKVNFRVEYVGIGGRASDCIGRRGD